MIQNFFKLYFLFIFGLFALTEKPQITLGDVSNTIHCVQGKYSCACCERFFEDCKKGTMELFEGQCINLDAQIEEIRESIIVDD